MRATPLPADNSHTRDVIPPVATMAISSLELPHVKFHSAAAAFSCPEGLPAAINATRPAIPPASAIAARYCDSYAMLQRAAAACSWAVLLPSLSNPTNLGMPPAAEIAILLAGLSAAKFRNTAAARSQTVGWDSERQDMSKGAPPASMMATCWAEFRNDKLPNVANARSRPASLPLASSVTNDGIGPASATTHAGKLEQVRLDNVPAAFALVTALLSDKRRTSSSMPEAAMAALLVGSKARFRNAATACSRTAPSALVNAPTNAGMPPASTTATRRVSSQWTPIVRFRTAPVAGS
mmetsp:Transcript_79862/g.224401  ORF Transcript_79862/g.224401 Transcript_79862/m.224401 type:complete len:295 (-) Transcript_79862:201-1085(-)